MNHTDLTTSDWTEYELLDSGDNKKLERFGTVIMIRPETQAIWKPREPEVWKTANAEFRFDGGKGSWRTQNIPETWSLSWGNEARFSLRLTSFKHIGVFPEQAPNWEWIRDRVTALAKNGNPTNGAVSKPNVLNLFGYTGIASIVAAHHGALVTHLDASRQSNIWAKENAVLSGIPAESIRSITDDAIKFVQREIRRGSVYDGIILDPPAFGRGPDGEVWKIEEDLSRLLDLVNTILSPRSGAFLLVNGYAAGYSPRSLLQAVESSFIGLTPTQNKNSAIGEFGELRLKESKSDRFVSSGIYVRAVR